MQGTDIDGNPVTYEPAADSPYTPAQYAARYQQRVPVAQLMEITPDDARRQLYEAKIDSKKRKQQDARAEAQMASANAANLPPRQGWRYGSTAAVLDGVERAHWKRSVQLERERANEASERKNYYKKKLKKMNKKKVAE